jgi:serine protease Do
MSNIAPRHPSLRRNALASAAAVAIVASGVVGATMVEGSRPALAQAPITVPQATAPATFADVVDRVKPAVVSVKVTGASASASNDDDGPRGRLENVPPQLREFFRRFGEGNGPLQQNPRRSGRGQAVGSGFFVSADGYVVTNNHVVDNGKVVSVVTDDGRTLETKIVGSDPKTDIALLKVTEAGTYPYVKLATTVPRVGDWVVAIGNPFGLGGTVTSGIVSARGRDIGAGPYDDFLQIDAPINRGNSGGPTFNLRGEVVGVNTAIASPSGGSVGLAFAIPAATVGSVVEQLQSSGQVVRGYLGVQIQPLNKELAEGLGLKTEKGALVNALQPNTPAGKAGLKSGDVITSVNGEPSTRRASSPGASRGSGPARRSSSATCARAGNGPRRWNSVRCPAPRRPRSSARIAAAARCASASSSRRRRAAKRASPSSTSTRTGPPPPRGSPRATSSSRSAARPSRAQRRSRPRSRKRGTPAATRS